MMESLFEKLLVSLSQGEVKYITVGGLACALNGFVRFTEDVDILVLRSPENLKRLLDVLSTFGEGYARELSPEDFTDEEGAIRINEGFAIDIFTRMSGFKYEDLEADILLYETNKISIPYLNAKGLIRLKESSLREKDRYDVIVLSSILNNESKFIEPRQKSSWMLIIAVLCAFIGCVCGAFFFVFYLNCALRFGFNDEGRCFDSIKEVVSHSESQIWGWFAIILFFISGILGAIYRRRLR